MADDSAAIAGLLDNLTDPLGKAGLTPDQAAADPKSAMAAILGPETPKSWAEQAQDQQLEAQNTVPPQPGLSPNGNQLPPGLNVRQPDAPPQVAAPATPPAVPSSVTPTGAPSATAAPLATSASPQDDPQQIARQALVMGLKNYGKSGDAADALAAQPDENQATAAARQAQENYAVPTNPNAKDPATGKPLYKPSVGQRIVRGVEGFVKGGVFGAVDPSAFGAKGYGAPNGEYDYTEQARQARENLAGTQLKQAQDAWKAAYEKNKAVAEAREKNVTGAGSIANPAIQLARVPIEQENADSAKTTAEAKQDKPDTEPKTYEQAVIAANTATDPAKKAAYTAAAKQIEGAEKRRFAAAQGRGSGGDKPLNEAQWQNLVNTHDREYNEQKRAKDAELKQAAGDPEQVQAINAKYDGIAADLQDRWNQRYSEADPEGKRASRSPKPQQPMAAPAAAQRPPAGAPQQSDEVAVIDPNGVPGYIPRAKLAKALAKGYKQPQGAQ